MGDNELKRPEFPTTNRTARAASRKLGKQFENWQGFLLVFIVFTIATTLPGIAQAVTESLSVDAGEDMLKTIELESEDRIRITLNVLGQTSHTLRFWITFPNSTTIDYGEVTKNTINFNSDVKGICELHFDNTNSSDPKLVTLNYEIEHYIFGMPQIPFLLIVVTVFLLIIVAGYITMGKYS